MNDNKTTITALVFSFLMIISPMAGAANVNTFGNGDSEVTVEVRDGPNYQNIQDGEVTLPAGDTVTSASMTISTDMATHQTYNTIDASLGQYVWDPLYNNYQTEYSNKSLFTYSEDSVKLVSGGFSTDFEGTTAGFADTTDNAYQPGWEHGILDSGLVLNSNCNTGDECWGTNIYDFDNDYTSDETSPFSRSMISPAMEVSPQAFTAKFSSWHGFHYNVSGLNNYYYDCGYVMVRNSSTTSFPPPDIDASWSYIPFDKVNSTGIDYSNGLYPVGIGNGRVQTCDSLTGVDYVLGGESTHPTLNPTGWAEIAINLEKHAGKYVQLKFVMKHNARSETPENITMPGWFIDDFRIGNPLPQSGWMTVKGFTPKQSPNPGFPDGYGLLYLEQETSPTNSLTATVLNAGTTEIVVDIHGNQMSGLEGPIIELWDIDSDTYPIIDIRLEFDTGQYRLSTSTLHGITIGTRVGTGFSDDIGANQYISDGLWSTPGNGDLFVYQPILSQSIYDESISKTKFSKPIVSITPVVVDNCNEDPTISLIDQDQGPLNLTVGQKWMPASPIFRFSIFASYTNYCEVSDLLFDLEFGHNAEAVSLDIANDGDLEWAMNEPAFGHFGLQTKFWAGANDGINYAMDSSNAVINLNGEATGGSFMLPVGAEIQFAEVIMKNNTIGEFDISLRSGSQEYSMGKMSNQSLLVYENMLPQLPFKDALTSLLANPLVTYFHEDDFGNKWVKFDFKISNQNASTNSDVTFSDLVVLYNWETTLNENQFLDRELNQGISLGTGNQVSVPIALSAGSGGAINLSDLQITTSSGYDSSLTLVGNPVGFYPNGDIIEAVSIHSVAQSTGAAFAEARLRMESTSGLVELSFSELSLFNEVYDPNNLVTLESSSYSNVGDEVHVTWRFKINPAWEDSAQLRIYASLIADDGVKGLPGSVVLAPANGNAIENDAMIASFELRNNGGELQNLTSATSNPNFNLMGTIRLEGLDVAPDPTLYNLSLQRWDVQNVNGTVTTEWVEVSNMSGVIGGNFDWDIDLGFTAVAQATYRFLMEGYDGGDTLCPPSPIISDDDCAIPFNLTLDIYSPTLVNISMLKNVGNDGSNNWDNWRNLVDDTWVKPSSFQEVRLVAQDIPEPPSSLDLYYWVEYDHDTDLDGVADPDEYVMMTLQSDGQLPIAYYDGTFSDDANKGQTPPGKVSIYVDGADIGGNPINGGMPGFDNDLVTYVSMDAKSPSIRNFFIEDSDGNRLHNPAEGAPFYQGPWNMTMYAGNQYHLIVEATDENGWRDIEWFEIGLGVQDMVIYYSPRNETAWTNSTDLEIIEAGNESDGPQILRMDGGRLVDAFEDEFYLDLPIRMNWDIIGIGGGTMIPALRIKDEGESRIPTTMSESGGRHKQRWVYSDGIQLDFRSGITPTFTDMVSPYTDDLNVGFVFPGDIVQMEGQYAYVDGINFEVYVLPEDEFTIEVTREEALMNTDLGYFAYPAGGADGSKTDGPTLHKINGGAFSINITAPINTNEYTYTFRLVDLPTGAVDYTAAICDGNNVNGCSSFKIKVDGIQPEVEDDKWEASSGLNGDVFGNTMPSSSLHCVDVKAVIEENAALIAGEVNLFWSFYLDAEKNQTWPVYVQKFGTEPQTYPLDVKIEGGDYTVSAGCVDLWPDPVDPTQTQLLGVDVILWIEGRDSAGWGIKAGGPYTYLSPTGERLDGVSGIYSSDPIHNSEYRLVYEQASFKVIDVRMTPKNPEVGQTPELEITLKNDGTKDGNITLEIQSVKEGGFPTTELTFTTEDISVGTTENIFVTDLEVFGTPTSGMYFIIVDADSNIPLWNGSNFSKSFNVAEASNDDGFLSGTGMLIVIGLSALILILLLAVVVLARRGSEDGTYEYEYEYENEVDNSVVDLPRAGPPSAGPPPPSIDPVMAAAMAEFPQWDQATIQGYFDQGWDIDSLRDWVNNNQ